ncbi:glycosyl transferase group 1 [Flexistipes sinusarabici DSM 4947]|uniref:Glycosyl transferase group 1 n=1 Tax=Flexistipes sinusarabici (strain ATCC 49648 / DSM 4947 / MAS 10) TaxID=717231 RepID=F8E429_FLESM|nr:glycosyltransferase family 4 protein [Flexistipes sinusarabici]AEI14382.1 glycosyl transferase group 1 [Flexistipes sinusarabici DSM 4947]
MDNIKNIGFVSTRIEGTDGVSLEIEKWAQVLERNNFNCFYFAGRCDREPDKSLVVPEAFFDHPEIKEIQNKCIGSTHRSTETSDKIHKISDFLKSKLYKFIKKFDIHLLIVENALAIPMNIPLGLAITEFTVETCFPVIAHHHDFYWERDRFIINAAKDYLDSAFPPKLTSIKHVTINSLASEQLSLRKGISNIVIPNVYDFSKEPDKTSSKTCSEIRKVAGLEKDDIMVLQPTRVVPRKWIERAVETVYLMNLKEPKLFISHVASDEGKNYFKRIKNYSNILGVEIVTLDKYVGSERNVKKNNNKKYTIGNMYDCADIITYPSGYEGFGNAFLETIYHKKPIIVNRYSIFIADIEPKDFDVITFDGFITEETVQNALNLLKDKERLEHMVEKNYKLGMRFFSYEVLEFHLLGLIKSLSLRGC